MKFKKLLSVMVVCSLLAGFTAFSTVSASADGKYKAVEVTEDEFKALVANKEKTANLATAGGGELTLGMAEGGGLSVANKTEDNWRGIDVRVNDNENLIGGVKYTLVVVVEVKGQTNIDLAHPGNPYGEWTRNSSEQLATLKHTFTLTADKKFVAPPNFEDAYGNDRIRIRTTHPVMNFTIRSITIYTDDEKHAPKAEPKPEPEPNPAPVEGALSTTDALAVLKHVVGTEKITDEDLIKKYDMDKDGELTTTDALEILKAVVGL